MAFHENFRKQNICTTSITCLSQTLIRNLVKIPDPAKMSAGLTGFGCLAHWQPRLGVKCRRAEGQLLQIRVSAKF
jgi:hypothetical protein